jgi:hypothetical protein
VEKEQPVENLRSEKRLRPSLTFKIRNEETSKELGIVLDFSVNGFMICSQEIVEAGKDYKLSILLPEEIGIGMNLSFMANCRWRRTDPSTGNCLSGFKILHRATDKIELIRAVILNYSSEE